jgi:hypothetical protein
MSNVFVRNIIQMFILCFNEQQVLRLQINGINVICNANNGDQIWWTYLDIPLNSQV